MLLVAKQLSSHFINVCQKRVKSKTQPQQAVGYVMGWVFGARRDSFPFCTEKKSLFLFMCLFWVATSSGGVCTLHKQSKKNGRKPLAMPYKN